MLIKRGFTKEEVLWHLPDQRAQPACGNLTKPETGSQRAVRKPFPERTKSSETTENILRCC